MTASFPHGLRNGIAFRNKNIINQGTTPVSSLITVFGALPETLIGQRKHDL